MTPYRHGITGGETEADLRRYLAGPSMAIPAPMYFTGKAASTSTVKIAP